MPTPDIRHPSLDGDSISRGIIARLTGIPLHFLRPYRALKVEPINTASFLHDQDPRWQSLKKRRGLCSRDTRIMKCSSSE